jgi:hypothetical protein
MHMMLIMLQQPLLNWGLLLTHSSPLITHPHAVSLLPSPSLSCCQLTPHLDPHSTSSSSSPRPCSLLWDDEYRSSHRGPCSLRPISLYLSTPALFPTTHPSLPLLPPSALSSPHSLERKRSSPVNSPFSFHLSLGTLLLRSSLSLFVPSSHPLLSSARCSSPCVASISACRHPYYSIDIKLLFHQVEQ